jgi:hypothetical protein
MSLDKGKIVNDLHKFLVVGPGGPYDPDATKQPHGKLLLNVLLKEMEASRNQRSRARGSPVRFAADDVQVQTLDESMGKIVTNASAGWAAGTRTMGATNDDELHPEVIRFLREVRLVGVTLNQADIDEAINIMNARPNSSDEADAKRLILTKLYAGTALIAAGAAAAPPPAPGIFIINNTAFYISGTRGVPIAGGRGPADPIADGWRQRFSWKVGKLIAKRLLGAAVAGASAPSPASMFTIIGGVAEFTRNSSGELVDSRGSVINLNDELMDLYNEAANRGPSCYAGVGSANTACNRHLINCMEGTGDAVLQCKIAMGNAAAWTQNAEETVNNMDSTSLVALLKRFDWKSENYTHKGRQLIRPLTVDRWLAHLLSKVATPPATTPLNRADFDAIAKNTLLTDFLRKVVAKIIANPCILNKNCDVPAGQVADQKSYGLGSYAGIPMHLQGERGVRNMSGGNTMASRLATPVRPSFIMVGSGINQEGGDIVLPHMPYSFAEVVKNVNPVISADDLNLAYAAVKTALDKEIQPEDDKRMRVLIQQVTDSTAKVRELLAVAQEFHALGVCGQTPNSEKVSFSIMEKSIKECNKHSLAANTTGNGIVDLITVLENIVSKKEGVSSTEQPLDFAR